jgi:hypothetical protein
MTFRWEELEIVRSWRDFLGDPGLYLRHLLSDEELAHLGG